jgi:ABC-type sugar transport system ATPase subunit
MDGVAMDHRNPQDTGTGSEDALVGLNGVSKRYGQAYAIHDVYLDVRAGEVLALLGENGAGKSTIAKILSGAVSHDEGVLVFDSVERHYSAPAEASEAGVAIVYQETSLVESMTVAQNLFLGNEKVFNRLSPLNIQARILLESHNFHIRPEVPVSTLGAGQKQMVEIARAVHRHAKLLILDEPTASVTPEEKVQLFLSMERLKELGVAIVFITHNLEEALAHADRVTVMRDGQIQATKPTSEFDRDQIVRMMVGRDVEYARWVPVRDPEPIPTLEVDNITLMPVVRNMSFSAYGGEILGMAGLVGAGRTEVASVVAGVHKRRRLRGGQVRLEGRPVRYRTPRHARRDGIVYITEDRKASGFFSHLSMNENVYLGHVSAVRSPPAFVTPHKIRQVAARFLEKFNVKALDPGKAKLVELSGGNQQKVVLAKGLTVRPKVAIIDEPTRGVDVGSIEEIHAKIRALADDGVAVVVISSYLPEILALSDRILVVRQGHVAAEFGGEEADEEQIMFAAVH